jgi:ParB family chromosome partitioning protein
MKKQNEPALGRGLDALLGGASTAVSTTGDVNNVSLSFIEPNPFQPRKEFDEESLKELAESIRHIGLVQPVTLKQLAPERYQIISGERRVRAARMAGLRSIPAYIRKVDDIGMLEMAIVENIQRENLDPIDTALSFQRLIEECNLTQEEMADRVGKKRSSVANYLRLLNLPPEIQKAVKEGKITMGHAKAILGVPDIDAQDELCKRIILEGLSVRSAEDLAGAAVSKPASNSKNESKKGEDNASPSAEALPESYSRLVQLLERYIEGSNISVKHSRGGSGSVKIRFGSEEELAAFLKALEQSSH